MISIFQAFLMITVSLISIAQAATEPEVFFEKFGNTEWSGKASGYAGSYDDKFYEMILNFKFTASTSNGFNFKIGDGCNETSGWWGFQQYGYAHVDSMGEVTMKDPYGKTIVVGNMTSNSLEMFLYPEIENEYGWPNKHEIWFKELSKDEIEVTVSWNYFSSCTGKLKRTNP